MEFHPHAQVDPAKARAGISRFTGRKTILVKQAAKIRGDCEPPEHCLVEALRLFRSGELKLLYYHKTGWPLLKAINDAAIAIFTSKA